MSGADQAHIGEAGSLIGSRTASCVGGVAMDHDREQAAREMARVVAAGKFELLCPFVES